MEKKNFPSKHEGKIMGGKLWKEKMTNIMGSIEEKRKEWRKVKRQMQLESNVIMEKCLDERERDKYYRIVRGKIV